MAIVRVEELRPGWRVAGNIYNRSGLILLSRGMALTDAYIERLKELRIRSVDILVPQLDGATEPATVLTPQLRVEAESAVRGMLRGVRRGGGINPAPIIPYVDRIVDQVLRQPNVELGLTELRAHDAYTYAHSVNVCMLATVIGRELGYSRRQLLSLGTGAILHDLGKVFVEQRILSKHGKLSDREQAQVRRHSRLGFETLMAKGDLEQPAYVVALHHHERLDGSGYPYGLQAGQLDPLAQIVAVADVYDAISSDRPYRAAMTPGDCIRILSEVESDRLWARAVKALIPKIVPYPEGCTVRLKTGELAVVVRYSPLLPELPQVLVFTDPRGAMLKKPYQVDLAADRSYAIQEMVSMESRVPAVAPNSLAAGGLSASSQ